RATALQFTPSLEVLYTRSLLAQLARNRQSSHITQTVPAPSTAAEGKGPLRIPPASVCACTRTIFAGADQLVPPFVELNAAISPASRRTGTTTVPLGCTRGCPPIPPAESAVGVAVPQVNPPSLEVLISSSSSLP